MAQFSMRVLVVARSKGQSIMASAAYRAGEKLWDERQGIAHDFRHKSTGVVHKELLFPADAPQWVNGISREAFWQAVDASEIRKDAQTARDLRVMIPREIPAAERIPLVRDFVLKNFVSKGMVADVCWHNNAASDGIEQPHAHILISMRPLAVGGGFGPKSRHENIPDPSGQTHPNGRPVMIESNPGSWNSAKYYEKCREAWEHTANAALERAGSTARIDRRSLLARGLARLPEPSIALALRLAELKGRMRERFGQFQMAKHYQAVEKWAGAVFRVTEADPAEPPLIMRDTVYCLCDDADRDAIRQSVADMIADVQRYVPGYRLKQPVQFESIGDNQPLRVPEMVRIYGPKQGQTAKPAVLVEDNGPIHTSKIA